MSLLNLLEQIERKGDKAIVYDKTGLFTRYFYDLRRDVILNPFDMKAFRLLRSVDEYKPFCIRQWVQDDDRSGFLFLSSPQIFMKCAGLKSLPRLNWHFRQCAAWNEIQTERYGSLLMNWRHCQRYHHYTMPHELPVAKVCIPSKNRKKKAETFEQAEVTDIVTG